jgi:hypothetical protein
VNRDGVDDLVVLAAGASSGAGEMIVYYGRSGNAFGVSAGEDGRRIVDFAVASNIDRKILGLGNSALGSLRSAQVFELTGEGAADIVVASPSTNSNTGTVFFTVSPRFTVTPGSATFTVNDNVTVSSAIEIRNPSIVNVTWAVSANRPWIRLSAASGAVDRNTPVTLTIDASSTGLGLGTHTGTVTLRSTSKHLDMTLAIPVTLNRVPLTAPTFVTATPSVGGIMLRWSAVPGATSYSLHRVDNSGASTVVATGLTSTASEVQYSAFTQAVRYTVTSVNSSGESEASIPVVLPWGAAGSRAPTVITPQDYDGDDKVDVAIYRSSTGEWFANRSGGGSPLAQAWGAPSLDDRPVPADYDGDGKADIAVYRASSGEWFVLRSSNGTLLHLSWGSPQDSDLPVPADYDGDGKADIAVYRPSTGVWFVLQSSNGTIRSPNWGSPAFGDIPVPADYDGDGKVDIAIYRGTTGEWFVLRSSNNTLLNMAWGAPSLGDVPVPADYDGDGKVDVAVYRAMSGQWFVATSTGGGVTLHWGSPAHADVPVPGDYDGDGRADFGVYRFSTGEWFIYRSSNATLMLLFWGNASYGDAVRGF